MLLTEELDQAKTALAEVQALRLEMNERTRRDRDEGEGGWLVVRDRLREKSLKWCSAPSALPILCRSVESKGGEV